MTVSKTVETFGRLDIVVNFSASVRIIGTATQFSEEDWDQVLDTNLNGTFLVSKAAIDPNLDRA